MYRGKMENTNLRKVSLLLTGLAFTFLFGTIGLHLVEGWTVFESFYMTVITISTVGFQELKPLSNSGRIITIFTIIFGITIVAYSIGSLMRILVEGELQKTMGRRKLDKKIASLKNHYIVCGYGRVGRLIARELIANKKDCVVIEHIPKHTLALEKDNVPHIISNAISEEALTNAGIKRAKALVTAVSEDSDNIFITLTARELNPDIFILARAGEEINEKKLLRAGANKVVLPYNIGGQRMVDSLLKPTVIDFLDSAMTNSELSLVMHEMRINPQSNFAGKTILESNLRNDFGIIVVAIKKHSGIMIFNPVSTEILESNDVLVVIGKNQQMHEI